MECYTIGKRKFTYAASSIDCLWNNSKCCFDSAVICLLGTANGRVSEHRFSWYSWIASCNYIFVCKKVSSAPEIDRELCLVNLSTVMGEGNVRQFCETFKMSSEMSSHFCLNQHLRLKVFVLIALYMVLTLYLAITSSCIWNSGLVSRLPLSTGSILRQ